MSFFRLQSLCGPWLARSPPYSCARCRRGWPFVFMFSVAAIMEAFLSPDMAVAAEALELTVQLALDFVDDLVRLVVINSHCERF